MDRMVRLEKGKPSIITCGYSEAAVYGGIAGTRIEVMYKRPKGYKDVFFIKRGDKWYESTYTYSELGIYKDLTSYYGYLIDKNKEEMDEEFRKAVEEFDKVMNKSGAKVIRRLI